MNFQGFSKFLDQRTCRGFHFLRNGNVSIGKYSRTLEKNTNAVIFLNLRYGFCLENAPSYCQSAGHRCLSTANPQQIVDGNGSIVSAGKNLPWLAKSNFKENGSLETKVWVKTSRSSWAESAEMLVKGGKSSLENRENRRAGNYQTNKVEEVQSFDVEEKEEEGGIDEVNDPRWKKIKSKFNRIAESKHGYSRPEMRYWDKNESWGKKTYREATESTIPKMVGEGIYGVGPVLAALSTGRREFYVLYVQEGLELSSNNRKKKDKRGFEKVLKIAERIGLGKKVVSKHDLNMITDNRPHQGLVLDASPLEMVGIKELDFVLEGKGGPLWVALDEVTDPQNLGAIIRSAYFFGATGVVLCAKNSAPLSGVVSKASAGSLEVMELRSCKNMMQFLASSAENGWRVLGGSVSPRAVPLNEVSPGPPTILVLGSEGNGLRPLVERSCTQLIRIPGVTPVDVNGGDDEDAKMERACSGQEFKFFMAVESLNVSVAAGVLLHHLVGNNCNIHSQQEVSQATVT